MAKKKPLWITLTTRKGVTTYRDKNGNIIPDPNAKNVPTPVVKKKKRR